MAPVLLYGIGLILGGLNILVIPPLKKYVIKKKREAELENGVPVLKNAKESEEMKKSLMTVKSDEEKNLTPEA